MFYPMHEASYIYIVFTTIKRICIKSEIVGAKFDLTLKSFPNLHKLSF